LPHHHVYVYCSTRCRIDETRGSMGYLGHMPQQQRDLNSKWSQVSGVLPEASSKYPEQRWAQAVETGVSPKRVVASRRGGQSPNRLVSKVFLDLAIEKKAAFTQGRVFTVSIAFVIAVNSIYIGIETDFSHPDASMETPWYPIEAVFSSIFLAEFLLRLYCERYAFFADKWNFFDMALVLIACIDTFVLERMSTDGSSAMGIVSIARILRVMRVARIVRLLRYLKRLWLLIVGIMNAMRALIWAWVFKAIIIFVVAILMTRVLGKSYPKSQRMQVLYGTVPKSMFTLFQVMTLEEWPSVVRDAMNVEPWTVIVHLVFLIVMAFSLSNAIIAVIVDSVLDQATSHRADLMKKEEAERKQTEPKILEAFTASDEDGDGVVTKAEFLNSVGRKDVQEYLQSVGIDTRQAENLFDILDFDDTGSLDADEFMSGVLKARGPAKSKEVLAIQADLWRQESFCKREITEIVTMVNTRLENVEHEVGQMRADLARIEQSLGDYSELS